MNEAFLTKLSESGLTPYALAKKAGVSYTLVNELVNGKKTVNKRSVETVLKLSTALNCRIEDLLDPVHIMDKVEGWYRGYKYRWFYDGTMKLAIKKKGGREESLDTGYQMALLGKKTAYPFIAEMMIDSKIEELETEKAFDQYIKDRRGYG